MIEVMPTEAQDTGPSASGEDCEIQLSVRDSHSFAEALLNPTAVNRRLRDTVRRYREATGL
jgi:uncharacterized protein (DUF1778 family)